MGGLCTSNTETLPTSSTVVSGTETPAWVSEAGKRLFENASSLAEADYIPYQAPRIATFGGSKFTDAERRGQAILSDPGQSGQYKGFFNNAYRSAQGLGQGYSGASRQDLIGKSSDPGSLAFRTDPGSLAFRTEAGNFQGMSTEDLIGGATDAGKFSLDDSAKEYLDIHQQAVDPAIRELERQTSRERLQNAASASSRGAFGGSRAAIEDITAAYEGGARAADLRKGAAAQGLQFASGQYERDRGARLSARESDRAARFGAERASLDRFEADRQARFASDDSYSRRQEADRGARFDSDQSYSQRLDADRAARLGVDASDREARFAADQTLRDRYDLNESSRLAASRELAGYAPMLQGLQEQEASGMLAVGEAQRDMDQRSLDLAYKDFLEQRENPYAMVNFGIGALKGVPFDTRTTTTKTGIENVQSPSIYGQTIAGLGSLYSAYKLANPG
jgi:hypothetical protein